jgi:hypothetical protein
VLKSAPRRSKPCRALVLTAGHGESLNQPSLSDQGISTVAAGFWSLVKELIAFTSVISRTSDPDQEIVDGWAEKLGLSRWYVWKTP